MNAIDFLSSVRQFKRLAMHKRVREIETGNEGIIFDGAADWVNGRVSGVLHMRTDDGNEVRDLQLWQIVFLDDDTAQQVKRLSEPKLLPEPEIKP